jgi:hypothetical protein
MPDETYNGWTNYETWGVALVLDNDHGTYDYVRERVAEIRADAAAYAADVLNGIWSLESAIRFGVADFLKDYTQELCGIGDEEYVPEPSLMARQLLGGAIDRVDFESIADHYLSD